MWLCLASTSALFWPSYSWTWSLRKIGTSTFSDPDLASTKYSCSTHFVNWQAVGFPTSCFEYWHHCYLWKENWNGNWSMDTLLEWILGTNFWEIAYRDFKDHNNSNRVLELCKYIFNLKFVPFYSPTRIFVEQTFLN